MITKSKKQIQSTISELKKKLAMGIISPEINKSLFRLSCALNKNKVKDDYIISNILEDIKDEKKKESVKKTSVVHGMSENSEKVKEQDSNLGSQMEGAVGHKVEKIKSGGESGSNTTKGNKRESKSK